MLWEHHMLVIMYFHAFLNIIKGYNDIQKLK